LSKPLKLENQRFGRLVVVSRHENGVAGNSRWLCKCDCGSSVVVHGYSLKTGNTSSCGCLHDDIASASSSTHGMSKTREYEIWCGMRKRCHDPACKAFKNYGGRGIKVCDRWDRSFEAFYKDMGECPPDYSIERNDNNGGYDPDNCRWASRQEQGQNKRNIRWIEHDGQKLTLTQWAATAGRPASWLYKRLARGLSIADALKK
jgi:hypothetical protein